MKSMYRTRFLAVVAVFFLVSFMAFGSSVYLVHAQTLPPTTGSGTGTGGSSQTLPPTTGSGTGTSSPETPQGDVLLQNPLSAELDSIPEIFKALLKNVVIPIAIPFVALAIIYTGFMFVYARGNKTELDKAKKALQWTLIGAAVILGAYVIAEVIGNTIDEVRPQSSSVQVEAIRNA